MTGVLYALLFELIEIISEDLAETTPVFHFFQYNVSLFFI